MNRLPDNLAEAVRQFCHYLRSHQFSIGLDHWLTALHAINEIDLKDKEQFQEALSLILCSNYHEHIIFPTLFKKWFKQLQPNPLQSNKTNKDRLEVKERNKGDNLLRGGIHKQAQLNLNSMTKTDQDSKEVIGFTSSLADSNQAITRLLQSDGNEMLSAARIFIRKLDHKHSRRLKPMKRGYLLDFRKIMRRSLSEGDFYHHFYWKGRRKRKGKIIFLCDSSRSMTSYENIILQFAYALTKENKYTEVFLFSTNIKRVTNQLKKGIPILQLNGKEYGGGTKIGDCLQTFIREYAPQLLKKDTTLIIASDGYETGELLVLQKAMKYLSAHTPIIWLNPLLSIAGFQPDAKGMKMVLPYIKHLSPITDSQSIIQLAKNI